MSFLFRSGTEVNTPRRHHRFRQRHYSRQHRTTPWFDRQARQTHRATGATRRPEDLCAGGTGVTGTVFNHCAGESSNHAAAISDTIRKWLSDTMFVHSSSRRRQKPIRLPWYATSMPRSSANLNDSTSSPTAPVPHRRHRRVVGVRLLPAPRRFLPSHCW